MELTKIHPYFQILDSFNHPNRKLSSGRITALDAESFYIPNLHLMTLENGYHFWVGNSTSGEPDQYGVVVSVVELSS